MSTRRRLGTAAASATAAIVLGVLGHHTAHVRLPAALRHGLARGLGVEPAAVSIGRMRLGLRGLELTQVSAGTLAARHLRLRPTLAALLGGRPAGTLEIDELRAEDPTAGDLPIELDRVEIGHLEVVFAGRHARVLARAATLIPTSARLPAVKVAELGAELEAGALDQLSGAGRTVGDALELRLAGPGARVAARLAAAGSTLSLTLEDRTLAWDGAAPAELGLPSGRVTAHGGLRATHARGAPVAVEGELTIERGEIHAPRLAGEAIDVAGVSLEVHARYRDGRGDAQLRVRRGEVALRFDARLASGAGADAGAADEAEPTLQLDAQLEEVPCAALLRELPAPLRRALDGMAVDGALGARAHVVVPLDQPAALALDGTLGNGCQVRQEPPLADVTHYRGAGLLPGAIDARGRPRRFALGAGNPSFRTLDQLPAAVVAVFVEAEDGRFWRHHGLDLGQLRRALAHDVEVGAPGRGGSTITQQVAKNLFLSGERTLGRKLEETVLSWRLESMLGKRRILELYLNLVELGPGVYGVAEGARRYFDKDVAALTADEAAQLAALLPAPRRGMDPAFERRLRQLRARLPERAAARPPRPGPPG